MTAERLLIVPSRFELEALHPELEWPGHGVPNTWQGTDHAPVQVVSCGVGLGASGARAGALLARLSPRRALVLGLAGSLDESRAPVPCLVHVSSVVVQGLGFGREGEGAELTAPDGPLAREAEPAELSLASAEWAGEPSWVTGAALSVARASDAELASQRKKEHPDCLVEDLESHSLVIAAAAGGVPLDILRATCNLAGDRRHAEWKVDEAVALLRSARDHWLRETEDAS
ncbi:MAG: hypothetical protein AAF533_23775 [Acidobacteriota bacterium]